MSRRIFPIIALLTALFASCSSIPDRVDLQWTEAMFFKNAQEAMDENKYKTALYYYEVFLIRYPENHPRGIAAEYEKAFINYKMGQYKDAQEGYEEIIRKYKESPYAMLYHPRFEYLSEIGLETLEKQKYVNNRLFWRNREKSWAEDHDGSLTDDGTGTEG